MTYNKARFRAYTYIAAGILLFVFGLSVMITAFLKGIYFGLGDCTNGAPICYNTKTAIEAAYTNIFPIRWLWDILPDIPFASWYMSLLSPIGILAPFSWLFAALLLKNGRELRGFVIDAKRDAKKEGIRSTYKPRDRQSVGTVHAGRGVIISEGIELYDERFDKTPIGLIVIAVIGGVISIVIGQVIIVALGLSH
jgi:hypothetical protein